MHETEVSDLESTVVGKTEEEYDMDTATVSYHSDDYVVYLGRKEVPDVTLINVVPADKPYVDQDNLKEEEESSNTTVTLM